MTSARPVPTAVPPDLYGRRRRDLFLGVISNLMNAHMAAVGRLRRTMPVGQPVDRSLTVVVSDRSVEARDDNVVALTFTRPSGDALPPWRPGAHIDLTLPSGLRRQYSLCGDPADADRYRIAVRRIPDGGGGSVEAHDVLDVGTEIVISEPRNAFAFAVPGYGSPARHLHFVAGGIGITPILPMLRLADSLGISWSMVYTGRSTDSLPFVPEVLAFGDKVTVRTDDVDGLPTSAELLTGIRPFAAIYACGPPPMIGTLRTGADALADCEFHFERFSAPTIVDGRAFTVELARSGRVVDVPADVSALDAIVAAQPDTTYSCRQGFCRTCIVGVLSGTPDHRDGALTDAERADHILICVSRSQGERLVLDL
ncbi:PDR/VanB family oxidoreductase [Rhodococcus sp. NPDC006774]|jgi:ferredoxin-NADP reductase|uniref:PDR/VanB family oxidoreductase n=1 Tax=Rhodococcus sp. NPDC006774 TaxID=3157186 RepID=UPI0033C14E4C